MFQFIMTLTTVTIVHAQAPTSPDLAGNWKLVGTLPANPAGQDSVLLLLKAGEKQDDWNVITNGIAPFKGASVKAGVPSQSVLELNFSGPIPLRCVFKIPGEKAQKIVGAFNLRGNWFPCSIERNPKDSLEKETLEKPTPGSELVGKLSKASNLAEKLAIVGEINQKYPSSPAGLVACRMLLEEMVKGREGALIRDAIKELEKACAGYPPQLTNGLHGGVALAMANKKWNSELAETLLEKIKKDSQNSSESGMKRLVLKLESKIYPQVGKNELANKAAQELESIDKALDQEFEKNAVPFATQPKTLSGFSKNSPAVVELFTGAQCPPCVAAEVAFDALSKSYTSGDLILLQYHLHIPGPDPMTNAHSELRARYYGVNSTPTMFLNGRQGPPSGGSKAGGQKAFESVVSSIGNSTRDPGHQKIVMEMTASKQGDDHAVSINFKGFEAHRAHILRVALVEDSVRYPGRNGQRIHHHVVRAFLGDPKGIAPDGAQGSQSVKFNIAAVRKEILEYLEKSHARRPFLDDERPLDLAKLSVVAWFQNIDTKEIVQVSRISLD
ncbi:MAG: hypothetical protein ACKO9Z_14070 [Planctomycetota bacterium]